MKRHRAIISLGFWMLGSTHLFAQESADFSCEIINRPVDCRRLTEAECEQVKREQEVLNLNRQMFCNALEVQKAVQTNDGAGGGEDQRGGSGDGNEGSQSGSGSEDGEQGGGTQGEAPASGGPGESENKGAGSGASTVPSSTSGGTQNGAPNANSTSSTMSGDDDDGEGPQWGSGALCEKFKSAFDKAKSEESRNIIRQQATSNGCK